jgi:hypothetical protein
MLCNYIKELCRIPQAKKVQITSLQLGTDLGLCGSNFRRPVIVCTHFTLHTKEKKFAHHVRELCDNILILSFAKKMLSNSTSHHVCFFSITLNIRSYKSNVRYFLFCLLLWRKKAVTSLYCDLLGFVICHNLDSHDAIFLSHGHSKVLSVTSFRKPKAHVNEYDDRVSHFQLLTHAVRTEKKKHPYRILIVIYFYVSNF